VVARSLAELTAGATDRQPMKNADSKSAASFERVVIGGAGYVVKVVDGRSDWLALASGDSAGRAICLWEDGVYAALPPSIDSTVVGVARLGPDADPWPAALLMRDVSDLLIPEDGAVDLATHAALLDAMADLCVHFDDALPATTYMPFVGNYQFLSMREAARQRVTGTIGGPQPFIEAGWASLRAERPELVALVDPLLEDPAPLADSLLATPTTFLHGDWKMGNLGLHPDGRVVLLDWDRPQIGPFAGDLAWYVGVNCDRLPESKEATVERFRAALERRGVATSGWWERQVALSLLGTFLMLGWSKAGQVEELDWWAPLVRAAVPLI
jgi:hypothetical protein